MGMGNMHLPAHERLQHYAKRKQDRQAKREADAAAEVPTFKPKLYTKGYKTNKTNEAGAGEYLGHVGLHVQRQQQGREQAYAKDFVHARSNFEHVDPKDQAQGGAGHRGSMHAHKFY